ncbi:MAG: DUF2064 domain-containing protein [Dokdonella sp.]
MTDARGVGLAIFVKTPALSPVKTRLQTRIGKHGAEAFHLAAAEAVASVALQAQAQMNLTAYWAVAEPDATQNNTWCDLPTLVQEAGSLGERMNSIYRQLRQCHRAAILIGADAPQISAPQLLGAAGWLDAAEPRLAIGRALDGGFWLFGGNVELPSSAWTDVAYSTPTTGMDFVAAMRSNGEWLELEALGDVDTFDDFAPVRDAIFALPAPTPAQQRVAAWMSDLMQREQLHDLQSELVSP